MTLAAARLALALAASAAPAPDLVIETGPGPRPWTHLNLANDPKAFQFAIVTDRTGGHREGIFESAVEKLNLLRPEFVMSVGDLVEGYTEEPSVIKAQRDEFDGFVRRLAAPFFYVPGNHDVTNPVMLASWKERYGRDYHQFVYRGVLFVGLNADDPYPAKIGAAQLAWLETTLAANRDARWTLVFLHRPLWDGDKDSGWDRVEKLLAGRKYTVFAGHQHNYWKTVRQDMRYITLATTGGGSQLRGLSFGEFDHVAWVTMSEQGPIVANLLLGGILDEEIVTEKTRDIPDKVAAVAPRQAVPVFAGAAPRRELAFALRATNGLDLPVRLEVDFLPAWPFEAVTPPARLELAPNSVTVMEVRFRAAAAVAPADLKPFRFTWKASAAPPGAREIVASGGGWLNAERPRLVPVMPAPTVDGRLGEWPALPYLCPPPSQGPATDDTPRRAKWKGPADTAVRFAVARDRAGDLYAAMEVTDDSIRTVPGVDAWDQDGVAFGVDARPVASWEASTKGPGVYLFASPGETLADTIVWGTQWVPSGVEVACVKTAQGYAFEAKIPARHLADEGGPPWEALRIYVSNYDFDVGEPAPGRGHTGTYINWMPPWDKDERLPGSGAFVRK